MDTLQENGTFESVNLCKTLRFSPFSLLSLTKTKTVRLFKGTNGRLVRVAQRLILWGWP